MLLFTLPVLVSQGIDVGALVRAAALQAGLTMADLWLPQGYASAAHWDRVLAGQAALDLWRLRYLTNRDHVRFWSIFLAKLASALITRSFQQAFEGVYIARADIRSHETKGRVQA